MKTGKQQGNKLKARFFLGDKTDKTIVRLMRKKKRYKLPISGVREMTILQILG